MGTVTPEGDLALVWAAGEGTLALAFAKQWLETPSPPPHFWGVSGEGVFMVCFLCLKRSLDWGVPSGCPKQHVLCFPWLRPLL